MEAGSLVEKRSWAILSRQGLAEDVIEGRRLVKLSSKNGFMAATEFLSKIDGIQKSFADAIDEFNRLRPRT